MVDDDVEVKQNAKLTRGFWRVHVTEHSNPSSSHLCFRPEAERNGSSFILSQVQAVVTAIPIRELLTYMNASVQMSSSGGLHSPYFFFHLSLEKPLIILSNFNS